MDRRARENEDTKPQNSDAAIDERRPVAVSPNEISFEPQPFLPGGGAGIRLSRGVIAIHIKANFSTRQTIRLEISRFRRNASNVLVYIHETRATER